ncbi:Neuraminidase [Penicillium canescens]|nr:Neuraminidase [Penicillium canescens]
MALIDFAENIIFQPDSDHSVLYPRQVELSDGSLLATASYGGNKTPYFPIFRSADGGATWSWVSNMPDQVNGLGMAAQPALAEMPFPVGNFPAGTVLASGNSWGTRARMSIYTLVKTKITHGNSSAMWRKAVDWILQVGIHGFGSHSFFCVFYSDQRDTLHGQKLAHQESTDLKSWSSVIDDVAYLNYTARPGMTVISYIPPLEKWILVHEFPGGDSWSGAGYPLYYRLSGNPFDFRFVYGYPIVVDGIQPSSSPYVVWSPVGGVNGTIVVSDADHGSIFTNRANGQPDQWEIHATPQPPAYSRSLHVFAKHPDHLMILGAAEFGQVENLPLHLSIVSLTDTLRRPAGN